MTTARQKRMRAMARKVPASKRSFSTNRLLAHEAGKLSHRGKHKKITRGQRELDFSKGDQP